VFDGRGFLTHHFLSLGGAALADVVESAVDPVAALLSSRARLRVCSVERTEPGLFLGFGEPDGHVFVALTLQ